MSKVYHDPRIWSAFNIPTPFQIQSVGVMFFLYDTFSWIYRICPTGVRVCNSESDKVYICIMFCKLHSSRRGAFTAFSTWWFTSI